MSSVPDSARSRRSMPARNRMTALSFGALGLAVLVAAWKMPPGIGNLPGPGFFPAVLGALLVGFSVALATERTQAADDASAETLSAGSRLMASTALLVAAYVLIWEFTPFLVRTPLLAMGLMRFSGASWRAAGLGALLLTLFLYGVFQLGLRVDLG